MSWLSKYWKNGGREEVLGRVIPGVASQANPEIIEQVETVRAKASLVEVFAKRVRADLETNQLADAVKDFGDLMDAWNEGKEAFDKLVKGLK